MTEIQLETERLYLKAITPQFIHHLFQTKSETEIMSFLGVDDIGFEKYLEMHRGGMETYQLSFCFFLLIEKESQLSIGECGFHTWNKKHHRAELFYLLKSDTYKQKGYMTEALAIVLKYGFENMLLHRLKALIADDNIPSIKLVNRYGFIKEGTMREDYFTNGKYEDSDCYSLLKSEWLKSFQG